ncbi:MAG: fumarylacetoacetate hydrolase family protein [Prevotella sp.]|nr:fumarylacetoacetate hydrolase family protein [Prevotella sp.]
MKIFCIGKNYALHNEEMDGRQYKTAEPVVFMKPESALLKNGKPFFLPEHLGRVDYECEVVVRISRLGKNVSERFAHRYYDAVTVGIDFTARDLQRRLKDNGHPWEIAKAFDGSAAIGEWVDLKPTGGFHFHLDINGKTVQTGFTDDMLYKVDELISYISRFFTLKTGDMLFTGTPVGVGPVHVDDHLEGYLEDKKLLDFWVR